MVDAIKKHAGGFTLFETMVVVALIAIVSAIAIPAWQGMKRNGDLKNAAFEIKANMQWAKSEAARRNTCIGINFNRPTPNSCAAGQGDCYELFADDNCDGIVNGADPILRSGGLGTKARINVPDNFVGGIAITPRGLLRAGGGAPNGIISLHTLAGSDLCYNLAISPTASLRLNPGRWNAGNCL